jgi:hypothetical protein
LLDRTGSKTCLVYIPHVGRLLAKQFVLIIIITEQLRCRHHRSVNLAVFWCQLHRVFLTYSLTTHVVLNDLMHFLLTSPKQQPNRSVTPDFIILIKREKSRNHRTVLNLTRPLGIKYGEKLSLPTLT